MDPNGNQGHEITLKKLILTIYRLKICIYTYGNNSKNFTLEFHIPKSETMTLHRYRVSRNRTKSFIDN